MTGKEPHAEASSLPPFDPFHVLSFVLWPVGLYALVCIGGMLLNRHFIYAPNPLRALPAEAGLTGIDEVELKAPDGVTLVAWRMPARDGKPTLLYFTGNAGSAGSRADKIRSFQKDGYGLLLLNYRGFGGSGGSPTEAYNVADGIAAYDYLRQRGLQAKDIVLYGESLGTGVAIQVAKQREARGLVLEAPFTSITDIGRATWWFLPLNLILTDQYRSIDHIRQLNLPVLIVHGDRDATIPVSHAKTLFEAAREPKELVLLKDGGHADLYEHNVWATIRAFLAGL